MVSVRVNDGIASPVATILSSSDPGGEPLPGLHPLAADAPGLYRSSEVRILVRPEEIDDLSATRLARDIVKKIEDSLTYPGQIKVTVIRETRAVEYAK